MPQSSALSTHRWWPSAQLWEKLRFLGLTSWFSKFIPNYTTVIEPLRVLLLSDRLTLERRSEAFSASNVHSSVSVSDQSDKKSFKDLKEIQVTSAPLTLFDQNLPILVSTDTFNYGLGGVLSQLQPDNTKHIVALASCTLSAAERKDSIVETEALACMWAVEWWRTYLCVCQFTLRTDHQALTTLLQTKGMTRADMRIASGRPDCFRSSMMSFTGLEKRMLQLVYCQGILFLTLEWLLQNVN